MTDPDKLPPSPRMCATCSRGKTTPEQQLCTHALSVCASERETIVRLGSLENVWSLFCLCFVRIMSVVTVKRPVLQPCAVDRRSRNHLYYYYYSDTAPSLPPTSPFCSSLISLSPPPPSPCSFELKAKLGFVVAVFGGKAVP